MEQSSLTCDQFKEIRKNLNMTQAEIGDKLGRSRGQVNAWETGKTPVPYWVAIAISTFQPVEAQASK